MPEDLRDPRRGREVRVLSAAVVPSASELCVDVWLEYVVVVVVGSAIEGTGSSGFLVDSEAEEAGAAFVDMMGDLRESGFDSGYI